MTTSSIRGGAAPARLARTAAVAALLATITACSAAVTPVATPVPTGAGSAAPPSPDPRVGLRPGLFDAGEAIWNLRRLSSTPPPRDYIGVTNSDLAFTGNYAIQGNYRGILFWDISDPRQPVLIADVVCPASQNDVSVYRNLLFVSGEDFAARNDCGTEGIQEAVSPDRFRGIRIFDISDIRNPRLVTNVQTCRGSHTHTVLEHAGDREHVYVYVSGSAPVRPAEELAGCVGAPPSEDPASARFRIEVIRVPLADPAAAAIVSSPRIFTDLVAPPRHGMTPAERAQAEQARAAGYFVVELFGEAVVLAPEFTAPRLDSVMQARGGTGRPTAADTAALQAALPQILANELGFELPSDENRTGPDQCHDITVYPAIGLAGGACEGYGLLLDISDPINPRRLDAVADSNFAYWHSATFNNDGTKLLFSDEWGGGGGAKCRATDPKEWGANAIFDIRDRKLHFRSYYKLPAEQTELENCVAHNGSLIPIPGRDVMVQAWYQGGISVFDFTDSARPFEIAFHDRGPVDANEMGNAGSWSVYWYNGAIVSSEIGRGLDIFELSPSPHISQNEIDAANTVRLEYLNVQGQPRFVWPATFALARAYVDQLERSAGLTADRIATLRQELTAAERAAAGARRDRLDAVAAQLDGEAAASRDAQKVQALARTLRDIAAAP